AEAARSLSQALGDDHDIAQLVQLVSTPTMTFGMPEEIDGFLKRCRKRQKALRKQARGKGERLFAERSRPFAERIATYWKIAAAHAGEPVVKLRQDEARQDNVVAFSDTRIPRVS
ncbi:MAG: hypothetical protein ACRECF_08535, partial [Methyloceanibacter sp.]